MITIAVEPTFRRNPVGMLRFDSRPTVTALTPPGNGQAWNTLNATRFILPSTDALRGTIRPGIPAVIRFNQPFSRILADIEPGVLASIAS